MRKQANAPERARTHHGAGAHGHADASFARRCSLLVLVLFGLPLGCGGPDVGDLTSDVIKLSPVAISSAPEVAAMGEPDGGLAVTRVFVNTSSVTLLPCVEDAESIVLSAVAYDLSPEPGPGELVTTAVTALCGIRVDIEPLADDAAEGVPEGASLHIEGLTEIGEPFELASASSTSLLLEAEGGVSFGDAPLLLAFDVGVWLAGVSPSDAGALELFEEQLQAAVAIYADGDDDLALGEDESTPVARVR